MRQTVEKVALGLLVKELLSDRPRIISRKRPHPSIHAPRSYALLRMLDCRFCGKLFLDDHLANYTAYLLTGHINPSGFFTLLVGISGMVLKRFEYSMVFLLKSGSSHFPGTHEAIVR